MAHTPGPWRVGKYGSVVVSDHPIDTEGIYTGHNDPDYYGGYCIAESIFREDDARLIAAAPDLLEACEAATEFIRNGIEFGFIKLPDDLEDSAHETLPKLEATIAKATLKLKEVSEVWINKR